jgi:hypothetical protein
MSFFTELSQNIAFPAGLQSVANLGPGASFTSGYQLATAYGGCRPNLMADQNCTLFFDQSSDGVNLDHTDPVNFYANHGEGWTFQITCKYVQIRVKNVGLAATTALRLQTALVPITNPLPNAVSAEGNLLTGVYEIESEFGSTVVVDQMRSLKAVEATRLAGGHFAVPTLDLSFWTPALTLSGTATVATGKLTLATGVTSASSAAVVSVRAARFVFAMVNFYRGVIRCPATVGANTRRWGAYDANNGWFFQVATGTFAIGSRRSGVDTIVASGSFNGKMGTQYVLDVNQHGFEIFWLASGIHFYIDGILLHSIIPTTAPTVDLLNVPITQENVNGANINNNTMEVWGATISRLGHLVTQPISQRINTLTTTVLKQSAGNLHRVILANVPTAAGTITIYDNTAAAGTILALLNVQRAVGVFTPQSLDFGGMPFSTGLTVVTAGNAPDITVVYE